MRLLGKREHVLLLAASIVARLPIGMLALGTVLTIGQHASLATASAAAAALEAGAAIGGVVQSRIIDRTRQTPLLLGAGIVQPALILTLALASNGRLDAAVLIALALCSGLSFPQITSSLRSIWTALDGSFRRAAFSIDAVVIEAIFLLGPALAGMLATFASPVAILYTAAALTGAGTSAFALAGESRAWRGRMHARSVLGPWTAVGIRLVLGAAFVFGVGDGAFQIAVFSFANDQGALALAALVFTLFSLASVVGGVLYGGRHWPGTHAARLTCLQAAMAVPFVLAAVTPNAPLFVLAVVAAGCFLSPLGIETSLLIDADAPAGTTTEAYAWLTTVVAAGNAIGLAVGGGLTQHVGARALMLGAALLLLVAAVLAALRWLREDADPPGTKG
ncbi:MAG: hypothetical protein M3301_04920 [Chloroflexota bacterium]|nr:hypothetical protein [Chloroflexota bacterium]